MIKITSPDGKPSWINPHWIDVISEGTKGTIIYFAGSDSAHMVVRESPAEVARLVAEAQRPTAGVDLEAVALARRVLIALTGNPLDLFAVLGVTAGDADAMIASVRNLAARLGGTP